MGAEPSTWVSSGAFWWATMWSTEGGGAWVLQEAWGKIRWAGFSELQKAVEAERKARYADDKTRR